MKADVTPPAAVRIGVLGAARIVKDALLTPSHRMPGLEVTAIAARDPARASAYAARSGIRRVHWARISAPIARPIRSSRSRSFVAPRAIDTGNAVDGRGVGDGRIRA